MKCPVFMNPATGGLSIGGPAYNAKPPGRPAGLTDAEFCVFYVERALSKAHCVALTKALGITELTDPRIETEVLPNIPTSFTEGVDYHLIEETEIPEELFRDAWEWNNGISTNMPQARVLHLADIRRARDRELEKQDILYLRALEAEDVPEQQRIAALKQTLRDIPQTFDLTKYRLPGTLKAAWPTEVPR